MDSGYVSCVVVIILRIQRKFRSGILKLFEGNFFKVSNSMSVYFSLTDIKT